MENSLLKQVLHEYEEKRARAAEAAEYRKKELLAVNPRLQEIENEISSLSIQTAKAMLNWGFSNYESVKLQVDKSLITDVLVENGETESVSPVIPDAKSVLVERGRKKDIKQKL